MNSVVKPLIVTDESITMMVDGQLKVVNNSHPNFEKVKDFLKRNKFNEALEAFDVSLKLQKHSSGKFYVLDGVVYMDATKPEPMPVALSNKVIAFADACLDFQPLVNFWNNLKKNPSQESVKDLYAFLEHNNIPITKDGCFIAYKRVSEKFKDIQTGTFDNTPGTVVKMDRKNVDADRNVTCSRGLHVAAYRYAFEFYANGKMLEVKVNPMNVVSVPVDYNNEKMRVCEYEVVKECEGPRNEALYTDDDSYNEVDELDEQDGLDVLEQEEIDECGDQQLGDLLDDEEVFTDKSGRLCVPARMLRALGLKPNNKVFVVVDTNNVELTFYKNKPVGDTHSAVYFVDRDNNIRISKTLLSNVGDYDSFQVEQYADKISIL
jgi:bifunctional DNA-binding transcriptional regulator/antitoxin component of YhaV-PrlF toxin-antitoxin module